MSKQMVFWVCAIVALVAFAYFFFIQPSLSQVDLDEVVPDSDGINVTYACAQGKEILATYIGKDKVRVQLSDGRSAELPLARSASGARYANADESFVFWNKGNTAFIQESGEMTFADCIEKAS
jgi:membrane-bound inhibitor of C-type lysozyme